MDGDQTIGAELARDAGLAMTTADWILEGGAVDGDGTGLVVTTEQCLLNPNRNPHLTRAEIEAELAAQLGFTRVLWLGDGLINAAQLEIVQLVDINLLGIEQMRSKAIDSNLSRL